MVNAPREDLTFAYLTQALSRDYLYLYYVDLDTGHYTEYSADVRQEQLKVDGEGIDIFEASKVNVEVVIHPDDRDLFRTSFNKDFMMQEIRKSGIFKMTYRLLVNGKYVYATLKASQAKGDEQHLIIGVTNADEQIRLRDARQRLRQEQLVTTRITALFGDLICIDIVDIANDHFQEYSIDTIHQVGLEKEGEDFFTSVAAKMRELVHPDDLPIVEASFNKEHVLEVIRHMGSYDLRYRLILGGVPVYIRLKAVLVHENDQDLLIIGLMNIDAQVKQENEFEASLNEARNQAHIDALTGVKNRHAYLHDEERLNRQIESGEAGEFAIAVFDINNLKQVNDMRGHQVGDAHIRQAAGIVCDIFKHSPVYRIGGDEFAAIIQGKDFRHRKERLEELEKSNKKNKGTVYPVIACGLAVYEGDRSAQEVFSKADQRMYKEKQRLKEG